MPYKFKRDNKNIYKMDKKKIKGGKKRPHTKRGAPPRSKCKTKQFLYTYINNFDERKTTFFEHKGQSIKIATYIV